MAAKQCHAAKTEMAARYVTQKPDVTLRRLGRRKVRAALTIQWPRIVLASGVSGLYNNYCIG